MEDQEDLQDWDDIHIQNVIESMTHHAHNILCTTCAFMAGGLAMLNEQQKQIILDALAMSVASNKRMQNTKPQFKEVFDKIARDLDETIALMRAYSPNSKPNKNN